MTRSRGPATAAFAAVAVLSLVVLFSPRGPSPASGLGHLDKVVHLTLFALLAATARWRFGPAPAVLLAVCAYAPLSELVQGLALPGRQADWYDGVADLTGVALGWLLASRLLRAPDDRPRATASR